MPCRTSTGRTSGRRARFAQREAVIARRDQTLRRLNAGEFFPAGHVLLKSPDGYPEPRRVEVAVTPTDFVLFEGENEISRIPRSEVSGLRLLDEHGEPVSHPPTEVEEMDQRDRQYVVWLDRNSVDTSSSSTRGPWPRKRGATSNATSEARPNRLSGPGDVGFWQAGVRNPADPDYPALREAIEERRLCAIEAVALRPRASR